MHYFSNRVPYPFLLSLPLILGASLAHAQAPTVVSGNLSPVRNAVAAPRTTAVAVPFSQAIDPTTASGIKIHSQQYRGLRTATASVSGGTVTLTPTAPTGQAAAFKPGEKVFVSVLASLRSTQGASATPYVYQFNAAASGGSGNYGAGATLAVGGYPLGVVLADVDSDGDLDMLVASKIERSVIVKLNAGNGIFTGTTTVAAGGTNPNVHGLAVGDVDGDGDLDFAVTDLSTPGKVSVRLNDGSGNFSGTTEVSVGDRPAGVALADFDGDGDLDLLTSNLNLSTNVIGTTSVRLNDGSGHFTGTTTVTVGDRPYNLAVGDLDGDGDLDFATCDEDAGTVSVRYNAGNGTFPSGRTVTVGEYPISVALGDIDGDGDLDLLAGNLTLPGTVSVRLNNGSGNFSPAPSVPVSDYAHGVTLGDVDGDGDLDLLVTLYTAPGTVSVYLNSGNGTFGAARSVGVGAYPVNLAVGDIDGDNDLDILTADNYQNNTVTVRLNAQALPSRVPVGLSTAVLFPNPAAPSTGVSVALTVAGGTREIRATLFDLLGRVVSTATLPVQAGQANGLLPTTGLPAGVYTVRLSTDSDIICQRLVLE